MLASPPLDIALAQSSTRKSCTPSEPSSKFVRFPTGSDWSTDRKLSPVGSRSGRMKGYVTPEVTASEPEASSTAPSSTSACAWLLYRPTVMAAEMPTLGFLPSVSATDASTLVLGCSVISASTVRSALVLSVAWRPTLATTLLLTWSNVTAPEMDRLPPCPWPLLPDCCGNLLSTFCSSAAKPKRAPSLLLVASQ